MADALCGPSNPLQSFRKQTNLDRTLQQDRLVQSRQSPAQGFRSHDPRAGTLDAELDAFEHAVPNPLDLQPSIGFLPPPQQASSLAWAADFQKLHINHSRSPVPVSQFRTEAPLVKQTSAAWHQDFLRMSGHSTPVTSAAKGKEAMAHHNMQSQYSVQPMMYNGIHQEPQMYAHTTTTQSQGFDAFSDEAFEAAFNEALISEAQALQQQESSPILQAEQGHDVDLARDQIRIGSDAIPYIEIRDRTPSQDMRDADELARTAGQLLNLVKDDTSVKFQNSQFLDLMRKLRDREVAVQDNDMVTTHSSQASIPQGANVEQHQDLPSPQQQQQIKPNATSDYPFTFPDMDEIYAPTNNDLDTASRAYDTDTDIDTDPRTGGSLSQNPDLIATSEDSRDQLLDILYHTTSDEFPSPSSQIQALHPGGKWYPEQSPKLDRTNLEMSGGVGHISAEDFDNGVYEESSSLGRRFGQKN